jgi:hypothetical protein
VRAFNTIPADSAYSNEVSATTLPGSGPGPGPTPGPAQSGGGGGCSVGGRTNNPSGADAFLVLMPMLAIMMLLRAGRKKK